MTIGFVGSATYNILPAVTRVFRKRFPNVNLILQEMTTCEQVEALQESTAKVELAMAWRRDERSPVLHKFLEVTREIADE